MVYETGASPDYDMYVLTPMRELKALAEIRDAAELRLRKAITEDGLIADSMREVWKHQNSGAE